MFKTKLRTDLRIVSSGRLFQIARQPLSDRLDTGFSLLKLTRIIYYCSVLHANQILCHKDIPTKVVVVAAGVNK